MFGLLREAVRCVACRVCLVGWNRSLHKMFFSWPLISGTPKRSSCNGRRIEGICDMNRFWQIPWYGGYVILNVSCSMHDLRDSFLLCEQGLTVLQIASCLKTSAPHDWLVGRTLKSDGLPTAGKGIVISTTITMFPFSCPKRRLEMSCKALGSHMWQTCPARPVCVGCAGQTDSWSMYCKQVLKELIICWKVDCFSFSPFARYICSISHVPFESLRSGRQRCALARTYKIQCVHVGMQHYENLAFDAFVNSQTYEHLWLVSRQWPPSHP